MKVGNVYNLESFKRFLDSGKKPGFTDSAAGVVLARQLTAVDPNVFTKRYPALTFMNTGIDVDNTGGYAERIQSLRIVDQGDFTTSGNQSGTKGKISIFGEDNLLPVVGREAQSKWTQTEIEQAGLQNINLPARLVESHNMRYMRNLDQIGLVGIPDRSDSLGLLNNSFFDSDSAGDTAGDLTGVQLYDALAGLVTEQRSDVNNTPEYSAEDVIMPTRVYNIASSKLLNDEAGSKTVLTALRENFTDVNWRHSPRADSIANGGELETSTTVAFSSNREAMVMRVPVSLTIGEVVNIGSFDFQVDSMYRIGGLDILESTAGAYLTGL